MSYIKDARSGAVGNTRLQKQYGAGSTPPRQHYAKGGRVTGEAPHYTEEIAASGKGAKRSFARSAKMRRKRADGGWTGEGDSGKALKEKSADAKKESLSKTRSMADWLIPATGGAMGALMPARLGLMRPASAAVGLGSFHQATKRAAEAGKAQDKAKALSEEGDKAEGRKRGGRTG